MKRKTNIHYILRIACLLMIGLQLSCIKDHGNYELIPGNPVKITYNNNMLTAVIDEPLLIEPIRQYATPGKTVADFDHEWYLNGQLYAKEADLTFLGTKNGTFYLKYHMIDKASGIRYTSGAALNLEVISPYQTGWGILYEKGGVSEIAHIRKTPSGYRADTDLYASKNNGQSLGSLPLRIKDYPVSGGRGLAIIQQGGQGSVELDGLTFEKKMVVSETFAGGTPTELRPVNIGFYETSSLLQNEDGTLYGRFFQANPIPFTIPWINVPLHIAGGMQITHLWDIWTQATFFTVMHDAKHNRLLYASLAGLPTTTNGGILKIADIPAPPPYLPTPPGYILPSNLGDLEYIWGGTFNPTPIGTNCVFMVREPGTGQVFIQSFSFMDLYGLQVMQTPGAKRIFNSASLLQPLSEFAAIQSRNFLFFSGGSGNNGLYYYDVTLGGESKLYHQLPAEITVLRQSDNSQELAVGLSDGTVIIYDISNQALISGGPVELHRLSGLGGRVADITVRGGYST